MRSSPHYLPGSGFHAINNPCGTAGLTIFGVQKCSGHEVMDDHQSLQTSLALTNSKPILEGSIGRPRAWKRLRQTLNNSINQRDADNEVCKVITTWFFTKGAFTKLPHAPFGGPTIAPASEEGKSNISRNIALTSIKKLKHAGSIRGSGRVEESHSMGNLCMNLVNWYFSLQYAHYGSSLKVVTPSIGCWAELKHLLSGGGTLYARARLTRQYAYLQPRA